MYKLYARKGSGSAAVEALLSMCAAPHVVIDVTKDADGRVPDWYLALAPRAEVPALVLPDGTVMTESAAIMMHIADCFPAARMAPALGTSARATYMRWMVYTAASPYGSDLRMYYPHRYSIDPAHADAIKAKAIIDLNRDFDLFVEGLGDGPFILGAEMTAVDIYAAMLIAWSEDFEKRQPKLRKLYEATSAHPSVRAAWNQNELP
jgi:glutathione S-transferase